MIKNWRLRNFKSFRDPDVLEFRPINVLAGANSSGKSSIIQSILLLKQTLQYGSDNRPIALNGPLLRLGGFEDVRNFDAKDDDDLEIGFEIELDESEGRGTGATPWSRNIRRHLTLSETSTINSISLNIAYNRKEPDQLAIDGSASPALNPNLISTNITVRKSSNSDNSKTYFAGFSRWASDDPDLSLLNLSLPYKIKLDDDSNHEVIGDKINPNIKGGAVSFFLPSWVGIEFDSARRDAIKTIERIFSPPDSFLTRHLSDERVPENVALLINAWLLEHDAPPVSVVDDFTRAAVLKSALDPFLPRRATLLSGIGSLLKDNSEEFSESIALLRENLVAVIMSETTKQLDFDFESPREISTATDYLKEFFKQGVRYLGPLRDSPRPVYQPEALEGTTDVGYRGEHTAAILDLNGSRPVVYHRPPSSNLEDDFASSSVQKRASLHDGVVEWLVYLGVADDVVTTDAGVFGNRLQVSTDGLNRLHDLTNVGVGVSQVLPIVVMSLLAAKGSLLIFEQPELHLHPKVQAKLADFFIALALDGKQLLLETHSEYLVDRFRLRIALSTDSSVKSLINILFSEKMAGQSELTPIEISEFGAILNWPKDFFEQSQRDVGRIVQAAAKKRRKKII